MGSLESVKPLYGAPRGLTEDLRKLTEEQYDEWFKEFVESYRCRICKKDLNLENFGGIGVNHMIFCKNCK